jgi:acetyltransferase-like isoleucine patch superfamily enzyme
MIGALTSRLAYLKYLFQPGFWRWLVHKIDYIITDQVKPWTQLKLPPKCTIHPSVSFRSAQNVELGSHTRIQPFCIIWASPNAKIRIGQYTGLGPQTMIYSSNHMYSPDTPYHQQPWVEKDVTIGRDCWIGGGSMIMPGVTIGDQCVIAAGTVVTKDIPAGSVAAGVPAKIIKTRGVAPEVPATTPGA